MASDALSTSDAGHPAPQRERTSLIAQLFGVFGAPLAWSGHELVNYPLASYACYPNRIPRDTHLWGWDWVWPLMLALCLLALAIGAAAGWVSYRGWLAVRQEQAGDYHHLLEVGEGRTRFLSMCGILTSLGFVVATVFDTITLFIVPLCRY